MAEGEIKRGLNDAEEDAREEGESLYDVEKDGKKDKKAIRDVAEDHRELREELDKIRKELDRVTRERDEANGLIARGQGEKAKVDGLKTMLRELIGQKGD